MASQRIPIFTIVLLTMLIVLHWLIDDKTLFYFSAADINRGETWRLLSGHLMHADGQHLLWNGLGLAVLGTIIEKHSRMTLWTAFGAGIVSVNVLLLTPFAQLDYYCGLSGVLNTLLLVALWLEWRASRSWLIIVIGCGSVAKVLVEVSLGASIVTHISWPPYAWSHVAGMIGGLMVILAIQLLQDFEVIQLTRNRRLKRVLT